MQTNLNKCQGKYPYVFYHAPMNDEGFFLNTSGLLVDPL